MRRRWCRPAPSARRAPAAAPSALHHVYSHTRHIYSLTRHVYSLEWHIYSLTRHINSLIRTYSLIRTCIVSTHACIWSHMNIHSCPAPSARRAPAAAPSALRPAHIWSHTRDICSLKRTHVVVYSLTRTYIVKYSLTRTCTVMYSLTRTCLVIYSLTRTYIVIHSLTRTYVVRYSLTRTCIVSHARSSISKLPSRVNTLSRLQVPTDVERSQHIQDSQDQILALACRQQS